MDVRVNADGQVKSDARANATPAFGSLLIAGATPYVTADIGSSNEVLTSTGGGSGGVAAGSLFGMSSTVASGLLTIARAGIYDVELLVEEFSNASGTGNVTFSVEKNSAAFSGADVMDVVRAAATAKAGLALKRRVSLSVGDTLRVKVADSAAGGAVTITGGILLVTQVADSITNKTA